LLNPAGCHSVLYPTLFGHNILVSASRGVGTVVGDGITVGVGVATGVAVVIGVGVGDGVVLGLGVGVGLAEGEGVGVALGVGVCTGGTTGVGPAVERSKNVPAEACNVQALHSVAYPERVHTPRTQVSFAHDESVYFHENDPHPTPIGDEPVCSIQK